MLAQHHVMKSRDNMSAVIEGLQREHGLLAAFLEACASVRIIFGLIFCVVLAGALMLFSAIVTPDHGPISL
jgi:hypothetical protein